MKEKQRTNLDTSDLLIESRLIVSNPLRQSQVSIPVPRPSTTHTSRHPGHVVILDELVRQAGFPVQMIDWSLTTS